MLVSHAQWRTQLEEGAEDTREPPDDRGRWGCNMHNRKALSGYRENHQATMNKDHHLNKDKQMDWKGKTCRDEGGRCGEGRNHQVRSDTKLLVAKAGGGGGGRGAWVLHWTG